jgi:hypothetical protein
VNICITISRSLAAAIFIVASIVARADEPISVDYHFAGDTGVNLSSIVGGPLGINSFTDGRENVGPNDISRPDNQPLTLTGITPTALIQGALEQAFTASGAKLADVGTDLSLNGRLIEMQVAENDKGIQVLIRCELTLRNGNRSAWQSVLFSQIQTDDSDIVSAIEQGLDRLVSELFMDDYFLMELGIF